jgi:hypothetical protein
MVPVKEQLRMVFPEDTEICMSQLRTVCAVPFCSIRGRASSHFQYLSWTRPTRSKGTCRLLVRNDHVLIL